MMDYQQARQQMIDALKASAEAHAAGRFEKINQGFDDLDQELPRSSEPNFQKLLNALYFWDCWIDDSNHGWRQYRGMTSEKWLTLANRIIVDLEADREIKHLLKDSALIK